MSINFKHIRDLTEVVSKLQSSMNMSDTEVTNAMLYVSLIALASQSYGEDSGQLLQMQVADDTDATLKLFVERSTPGTENDLLPSNVIRIH
jgi:hypothetical protein